MTKKGRRAFDGANRDITYPIKSVKRDWPEKMLRTFQEALQFGNVIDHPFTVTEKDGSKKYCVETYCRMGSKELMLLRKFCLTAGFDYEIAPRFSHWNPSGCTCIAFHKV